MLRRLTILFALALAAPALAQAPGAPTHGVVFPLEMVTGMDGAPALEVNPAGLGFLNGWDLVLHHAETESGSGRGTGALFGVQLFGPVVMGVNAQFLRPEGLDGYFKGGFGIALAASPAFSFGLSYHGMIADTDSDLDSLEALDLGFIWRPLQWMSIGAAVHDLTSPVFKGNSVPRTYDFGLAFRPGTSRVTIEGEVRIDEDSGDADPAARLLFDPAEGFHVGLGARFLPRGDDLGISMAATVGFDWALLGVEAGGLVDLPANGDAEYAGFTTTVRVTNQPRHSIGRPGGVWVELALEGSLSESPRPALFSGQSATFTGVITYLERLRQDDHVDGLIVRLRSFDAGWAQIQELRSAVQRLKSAGKKVFFHFSETGTRGYLLASAGDGVWVDPGGGMWLTGLYRSVWYYEEILATLGVEAQFVKHGKYKSFPEAFTEGGPTDAANEVQESLLDTLYGQVVSTIAVARGKTEDQVRAAIDDGPYTSQGAIDAGLIDGAAYWDEVTDVIAEKVGHPIRTQSSYMPESPLWGTWGEPDRIAVIVIEGSIVGGRTEVVPLLGMELAGARTIIENIDAALSDSHVKALVLRIDSPGGSSLASDLIWRKVVEARKHKPVIVSMSNVCASGGYYIAAAGSRIFADPATFTGSIGIFTGKFSVAGLFDMVGVDVAAWKRGKNADLLSFERPWTDEQVALIGEKLRFYYNQFLEAVAVGRGMTVEQVDEVAQGRVWLGSQATERKLVDEIGGIHEAILAAKHAAGRDPDAPMAIRMFPQPSFLDRLLAGVLPRLSVYSEIGAPPEEQAPVEASEDPLLRLVAPLLRMRLGGAVDLLPFASGEPLTMLPFHIEWTADVPHSH